MPPIDRNQPKITQEMERDNKQEAEFIQLSIERLLQDLPSGSEMLQRWQDKYDEAEDLKLFLDDLKMFVNTRKKILSSSLELFPLQSETIKNESLLVSDCIKATFRNMDYFLGNGYTAEVYELPVAPHLCVKYIHNQKAYNENNHIRVEYDYLCGLHNLRVDNVRAPLPAFIDIHLNEGHRYGMERVNGKSLSQILEHPTDNLDMVHIAKQLDRDKIVDSVLNFLKKMHQERGITHNDLYMRNIMLDREGNIFIIDFGKANSVEIGNDRDDEKKRDLTMAKNEILVFFRDIDNL